MTSLLAICHHKATTEVGLIELSCPSQSGLNHLRIYSASREFHETGLCAIKQNNSGIVWVNWGRLHVKNFDLALYYRIDKVLLPHMLEGSY